MIMLLFAFTTISIHFRIVRRSHFVIALLNIAIPLVLYFVFLPISHVAGLTAFLMGIAPTAAGAPILAQFLRTDIGYVTTSVLINSPLMALIIPILLPIVADTANAITLSEVFWPVVSIVGLPLIISQMIRQASHKLVTTLHKLNWIPFALFLINVWIGCGNATHHILYKQEESLSTLMILAGVIALTCLLQFKIGEWIKRDSASISGGLALGRKNTMFALWIALTFLNPILALGPIFYILAQNIYNGYQMVIIDRNMKRSGRILL